MGKGKQMTFEEALESVPTHIILHSKMDKWQAGDEVVVLGLSVVGVLSKVHSQEWEPYDKRDTGRLLLEKQIGRRPIPESVRTDMAKNLLSVFHQGQVRNDSFETWLLSCYKKETSK